MGRRGPQKGSPNAGPPKGSHNAERHGLLTLRNSIRKRTRRGRSFIDLRSGSGRNAVAIQAGLIADLGGMEHISTAQKLLIELVGRHVYLLDETDHRIVQVCKEWPKLKKSPKGMAALYSYRQPITSNISRNLLALGLEKKPPPQKPPWEEILADDNEQEGSE